jgi:hypothetical protein
MRRIAPVPFVLIQIAVLSVLFFGCQNRPPSVPTVSGPSSGNTNVAITVTATATDPDRNDISMQFEWGDQTDTSWSSFVGSGQALVRPHIYQTPGAYSIRCRAKDSEEKTSDWSTGLAVAVSSQAPATPSTPNGPTSGFVNVSYDYTTSTTDPDGNNVAYQFDWGDGSAPEWTGSHPSGEVVAASHAFATSGSFSVRVKARDDNSVESGWSQALYVAIASGGWQTVFSEGFEGAFPGSNWTLYGTPTWDDEDYRSYAGGWSGWCAGSSYTPPGPYPANMFAWMVYGPFSLVGATDAHVLFQRWAITESGYDSLWGGASVDGNTFYRCYALTGSFPIWEQREMDLTVVPTLGNLCGRSQVWITFLSKSDVSNQYEGAYVDDIVVEKYVGYGVSGRPPLQPCDPAPPLGQSPETRGVTVPGGGQR